MNTKGNQRERSGLTRRGFLAGASVGAMGLAAAGILGCAPESSPKTQEAQATERTKGSASPSNIEMTETVEADVVVIGTGVSGLTAAISAAEGGARVTVVEKLDGLKKVYAHSITAIGTSFQQELGEDWSPEELVAFWNQYPDSDSYMDKEAQLFAARHSAESIDWLIEHGVDIVGVTVPPTNPFQVPARTFVTSADRDGVKAYLEPLKAKAEELGVEFRFSTEATKIVVDETGAVTGLETVSGGTGTLFKSKSLVVAAGGFGASPDLLRLYAPHTPNCSTFDGESKGFALTQAPTVHADVVAPGGTMAYFVNVDGASSDNPGQGMFVNREGKRWVNENLYFLDRAGLAYKQGITEYWALYDSTTYQEVVAKSGDKGLESGTVIQAYSIEDLARATNINTASLKASVDEYNAYCSTGEDAAFGKPAVRAGRVFDPNDPKDYDLDLVEKEFKLLNPLSQAPFYAVNMTVQTTALSGTTGGMRTNTDGEVLDIDGAPIPNLYAVGESANGHLIGYFYPQSGTSLCMCFCFGRYAGAAAAANAKA